MQPILDEHVRTQKQHLLSDPQMQHWYDVRGCLHAFICLRKLLQIRRKSDQPDNHTSRIFPTTATNKRLAAVEYSKNPTITARSAAQVLTALTALARRRGKAAVDTKTLPLPHDAAQVLTALTALARRQGRVLPPIPSIVGKKAAQRADNARVAPSVIASNSQVLGMS